MVRNMWMNDVRAWMSPECLQQYYDFIDEEDELDKAYKLRACLRRCSAECLVRVQRAMRREVVLLSPLVNSILHCRSGPPRKSIIAIITTIIIIIIAPNRYIDRLID